MNCQSCLRELRWQSIRLKLDMCRQCRHAPKQSEERILGRLIGQYLVRAFWS
jgi:hypothetical protein